VIHSQDKIESYEYVGKTLHKSANVSYRQTVLSPTRIAYLQGGATLSCLTRVNKIHILRSVSNIPDEKQLFHPISVLQSSWPGSVSFFLSATSSQKRCMCPLQVWSHSQPGDGLHYQRRVLQCLAWV